MFTVDIRHSSCVSLVSSSITVLDARCYSGSQVKENEIGEAGRRYMQGDHFEDLDTRGSIILKWILKNCDGRVWSGLIWLRVETSG